MAISLRCKCKRTHKITARKCMCGNDLTVNRKYRVNVRMPNGKRITKQVDSLDLAKKVEAKFKTQAVMQDVFNIHSAPIIDHAWRKFLSWAKINKRTWDEDLRRWDKHIKPILSNILMDKVTPTDVQKVMATMYESKTKRGTPYAPSTIKQVYALLSRIYNWSIKNEIYYGANPCSKVDPPKFDNRINNVLTKDELKRLNNVLDHWQNRRAVLVIRYALYSGKRKGEILNLKWSDIDLDNGFVTYRAAISKNRTRQTLPLNDTCLSILKEAYDFKCSEWVFPSEQGNSYYISFNETWRRIKKRAKVELRFHDLRHTFASYLASSGEVDIYTLKELLGHKTMKMTERYAHLQTGTLKRCVDVADRVL